MKHKTADVRLDNNSSNSTTDIDLKVADVRLDNDALCVDCQSSSRLITDYFAGELDAPASEQFMAHIETCETCRQAFETFDELWSSAGEALSEDNIIDSLTTERKAFIANAATLAAKQRKKSSTLKRRIIEYGAVAAVLLIFAGMLLPALNSARGKGGVFIARNRVKQQILKDAIAADINGAEAVEAETSAQALGNYREATSKSNRGKVRIRRTGITTVPVITSKFAKKMTTSVQSSSENLFGDDYQQTSHYTAPKRQKSAGRGSVAAMEKIAGRRSVSSSIAPAIAPMPPRKIKRQFMTKNSTNVLLDELLDSGAVDSPKELNRGKNELVTSAKKLSFAVLEQKKQLTETDADKYDVAFSKSKIKRRMPFQQKIFKLNLKLWNITTTQNLRNLMQQRGYPLTARVSINRHNNTITFYDTATNLQRVAKLFSKLQIEEQRLTDFRHGIPMVKTKLRPVSTFSIDTDTASYIQAKRLIMNGLRPDPMKIREEEFVNYFDYHYRSPKQNLFGVYLEAAPSPFRPGKNLLRIGIQGKKLGPNSNTASRYTVLFDGSGSMAAGNRLELAFQTLQLLFKRLTVNDRVSLIVCNEKPMLLFTDRHLATKTTLKQQLNRIKPAGAADFYRGLKLAYRTALHNYLPGGINKVIIISDGIVKLPKVQLNKVMAEIDNSRRRGISNIVIGVGGDGDDQLLEQLAAAGDGSYVFIDRHQDAVELFNQQFDARFREIARDVKIQVEFNAGAVPEYRQLGYRNRQLSKADFRNDKINAGEVGSDQSVTALYEMKLNRELPAKTMLAIVRLRYKPIDSDEVVEEEFVITSNEVNRSFSTATPSFKLATFVAEFAESLRYPETPDIASPSGIGTKLSPLFQRHFSNDGKVAELLILMRKVK